MYVYNEKNITVLEKQDVINAFMRVNIHVRETGKDVWEISL